MSPGRKGVMGLWLALALLAALLSAGCGGGSAPPGAPQPYEGTRLEGPAPEFQLTDKTGSVVRLSDFRGRVVALAFLDPRCTDICPLTALHFRRIHESLGNRAPEVVFLAVNTNPNANSQADLIAATERWGLSGVTSWHFLRGTLEELLPVWSAYGVAAGGAKPGKPGEVEHTPGVYVIDRSGRQRWYISIPLDDPSWTGPPLSDLLHKHVLALLLEGR